MKNLLPVLLLSPTTARQQGKLPLHLPPLPTTHTINYSHYQPPGLRSYDPTNPNESCYTPLYESDVNQDGLSHEEYVTFIEGLEPRLTQGSFKELAFVLKVNFVYLSCLCEDGGNSCCKVGSDGSISTSGAGPNDTPTEAQIQYLDTVCSTTQASIEYALKELPPTPMPSESPTMEPSYVPTVAPVTEAPSTLAPSTLTPSSLAPITTAPTYMEQTDAPASSKSPSSNAIVPPTSSSEQPTTITSSPSFTAPPSSAPSLTDRAIGGTENTSTTTLSSGSIAGIVLASAAILAAGLIVGRKRRREEEEDPSLEFKGDLEMGGDDNAPSPTLDINPSTTDSPPDIVPLSPEPPIQPHSPISPYSDKFNNDDDDSNFDDDSSSSAGQSGWSSSQGLSSLNTASFDAGEEGSLLSGGKPATTGSALAAIGVASAVAFQTVKKNSPEMKVRVYREDDSISSEEEVAEVSRKDLDAAIEAGDWAAVGATAALLANTSERGSSSEDRQIAHDTSRISDLDDSRTNELDKLVEVGDWEGVVLAAAQFEGQQSDIGSNDGSQDHVLDDGSEPSLLAKGNHDRLEGIRAEVELLVRRIVPDELDNIDEMMIQFAGRENELIETLKTMQERSIAQRARAAVQQSAKLEAKARGQNISSGGGESTSSSVSKSLIEKAVEKGDWQAVGHAAAMMGGDSAVIEDDTLDQSGHSSSISSSLSESRSRSASRDSTLSRDQSERIQHLDNLIAVGDWAGIVAVASQYQAMDEEIGQSPPMDASLATEEERDALAQAEMWRAIAQQSKQDISSAKVSEGAKEAADWAISRSLAKHSTPSSSATDQPDAKVAKIETYEDDQSV